MPLVCSVSDSDRLEQLVHRGKARNATANTADRTEPSPAENTRVSAATARHAVRHLREQGVKAGLVKLRFVRPFPSKQVAAALSKFKAVGVIETSTSYGGSMRGGNLLPEVRAALYDAQNRPLTTSFMAGLGGDVVTLKEFYWMAEVLTKAVKTGRVGKTVYWAGLEEATA